MLVSELLEKVFEEARNRDVSQARLAEKAGIRPEHLSRLKKNRRDVNFSTMANLIGALGYELALKPINKKAFYSPSARARSKALSRKRDRDLIASGRVSPGEIHRRNAAFSFQAAKFEIKGI